MRTGIVATIAVIVAIWQTGRANEEPRLKIESVAAGKVIVIGRRCARIRAQVEGLDANPNATGHAPSNREAVVMQYELSDKEWDIIRRMLPTKPRGVLRVDDRRVLNGIFWVLRSGAPT